MTTQTTTPLTTPVYKQVTRGITPRELEAYKATLAERGRQLEAEMDADATPAEPQEPTVPQQEAPLTPAEMIEAKRYWDLKKHHDTVLPAERARAEAAEKERDRLAAQLAELQHKPYAPKEAVDAFVEENDEVAQILRQLIADEAAALDAKAEEKRKAERAAEQETLNKSLEKRNRLNVAHPGWEKLETDELFLKWFDKQTNFTKARINSDDVEDVIAVLDMFKSEVKAVAAPSKKDLARAVEHNSPAEIPQIKNPVSLSKWKTDMEKAQRLGKKDVVEKLLADIQSARAEKRIVA